jgi:hypothetical protein
MTQALYAHMNKIIIKKKKNYLYSVGKTQASNTSPLIRPSTLFYARFLTKETMEGQIGKAICPGLHSTEER